MQSLNWVVELLKQHLQNLIAAGSFVFALVRWWKYREKVLFRRLEEMLKREKARLGQTRADLFSNVLRPSVGTTTEAPTMSNGALGQTLVGRGLIPFALPVFQNWAGGRALQKSIIQLQSQRQVHRGVQSQVERELANAFLLRGAIETSRADISSDEGARRKFAQRALHHYDMAIRLAGDEGDLDALELKAYQLLKIGEVDKADVIFESILAATERSGQSKQRDLRRARAWKCQAVIIGGNGNRVLELLSSAVNAFGAHVPHAAQDLLDQAQINEFSATVRFSRGHTEIAAQNLNDAEVSYELLKKSVAPMFPFGRAIQWIKTISNRKTASDVLYSAAVAGLNRVSALRP
ncbi:MAG: hypothetical protein WC807_09675 [Hyphomicrobium sp.]